MANLKRDADRFMLRNRDKGIPNLMLYIGIGNAVVYVVSLLLGLKGIQLSELLEFDAERILAGQVWRLISYPFTLISGGGFLLFKLLFLYFYYWIGKVLERIWGSLKLNLYYLSGLLLLDLAGVLLYAFASIPVNVSATYLHMSLFLAVATLCPEQKVLLYFIIPIKMRWLALVYVALSVLEVLTEVNYYAAFGGNAVWIMLIVFGAAPLLSLVNYLLFFGRNVKNLFVSPKPYRTQKKPPEPKAQPGPDWAKNYRSPSGERPYRHKCTVCGRTDTDCPDLEFRYCSKCAGYFCYCIDHINNHTHVQ